MAALNRAADTVDHRSRGAVLADTLVQRVTGRPAGTPEPVAVNLVLSDQTLLAGDDTAAVVDGDGPIPGVARSLVDTAVTDERSRATLRRFYRHPTSGALVAMESQSRCFPRGPAKFIGLRDLTCRTPYCDARSGTATTPNPQPRRPDQRRNGLGMCERCTYVKEAPGWHVCAGDENGVHTAEFTTPTGMRHHCTAPPPPGPPPIAVSEIETRIGITIARHAA